MHDDSPCTIIHGPDVQIILSKTTKLIYRNRVNVCSRHTELRPWMHVHVHVPSSLHPNTCIQYTIHIHAHAHGDACIPRPHVYLCMYVVVRYMRLASLRKTQGTSRLTSIAITWRLDTERYSRNVYSLNKRRSCHFSMQPDVKIVAGVCHHQDWLR